MHNHQQPQENSVPQVSDWSIFCKRQHIFATQSTGDGWRHPQAALLAAITEWQAQLPATAQIIDIVFRDFGSGSDKDGKLIQALVTYDG